MQTALVVKDLRTEFAGPFDPDLGAGATFQLRQRRRESFAKGHLMRICRINRGSLKVLLCRDMHDVIILQRRRPGSVALGSAAAKCFTASATETRYE